MKILWIKIPKEIQKIIALFILLIIFWIYSNMAWIVLLISLIIFFVLIYIWLGNITNKYNYHDSRYKNYKKNIWIVSIILSLFPLYFAWYIWANYNESNKYLQEKSIWWITEIWKFAISGKRFNTKNILKQIENNVKDNLKEKVF